MHRALTIGLRVVGRRLIEKINQRFSGFGWLYLAFAHDLLGGELFTIDSLIAIVVGTQRGTGK